jgi:hypothetical protein
MFRGQFGAAKGGFRVPFFGWQMHRSRLAATFVGNPTTACDHPKKGCPVNPRIARKRLPDSVEANTA